MAIMAAAPVVAASRLMLKDLGFIFLMALTAEGAARVASQPWKRRCVGPSTNPFRPKAGAVAPNVASPFVAPAPGLAGVHTRNLAPCQGASGRVGRPAELWFRQRA